MPWHIPDVICQDNALKYSRLQFSVCVSSEVWRFMGTIASASNLKRCYIFKGI